MKFCHVPEEDGSVIAAECDRCGGQIYRGQTCYWVNGETVCEDCLGEFAREFFAPFRVKGGEETW